jgi:hypothetical protein
VVAANNDVSRDIVPTTSHSVGNALNREIRGIQPEVEEVN